jgi:putative hydrolase of the HAD superfamily
MSETKFRAIGFDLGGVIINYSIPAQLNYLSHALQVDHHVLDKVYHALRPPVDVGEIDNKTFWARLIKETGSPVSAEDTEHLWTDNYVEENPFITGMLELVDTLKKNGYKVGLLSNIDPEHGEINRRRHILEHFDAALLSYDVRARKPEPEAFQDLIDQLGVKPEELIFIDDLPENIEGAKRFGAYGIQFQGYQELVKELRALDIKL